MTFLVILKTTVQIHLVLGALFRLKWNLEGAKLWVQEAEEGDAAAGTRKSDTGPLE